jgi:hypothetical protein
MARVVQFSKKGRTEMPYKNPEHKRQREREHRDQRNAQRRNRRSGAANSLSVLKCAQELSSNPAKEGNSGLKSLLAFAIGLGVVVLGAFSGLNMPLASDTYAPNVRE